MAARAIETIRGDLKAAEALAEQQKREEARQQIEKLSEQGSTLKQEISRLSSRVKAVDGQRDRLTALARRAREEFSAWSAPLPAESFPTKAQKAERAKQAALWKAELDRLSGEIAALPETFSDRMTAIKLNDQLNGYIFTLQNLKAIATGRKIGSLESGLSRVEELPNL